MPFHCLNTQVDRPVSVQSILICLQGVVATIVGLGMRTGYCEWREKGVPEVLVELVAPVFWRAVADNVPVATWVVLTLVLFVNHYKATVLLFHMT